MDKKPQFIDSTKNLIMTIRNNIRIVIRILRIIINKTTFNEI